MSFGPNWTSGSASYGPRQSSLSLEYFNSLQEHAVPLNEADLAALAHSALALDLYAWLAQRLHRINPNRPRSSHGPRSSSNSARITRLWTNFKQKFRVALRQVQARYKAARFEIDGYGMRLHQQPASGRRNG